MKKNNLLDLMRAKNTLFTVKEVALIWEETDMNFVRKKLHRYVKAGKLYSVRKGIYTKDEKYEKFELATKIFTPSYISFETVLAKAGIVFQFYGQIFVASYCTRTLTIDGQTYSLKKIRDSILTDKTGLEEREGYFIASPERAFLDVVYLNKEYYFDNLVGINWDKVSKILPIYGGNRRMEKEVKKYHDT